MADEIPPTQPPLSDSGIETVEIEQEVQRSYIDYAMSVIVSRALPDVRDGLKPVHRRILYSMYREGLRAGTPYRKAARVVGDVTAKYHPHSPEAVYDSLARMAQDFALRHPLVDGRGNFGSADGDPPAAMRYCFDRNTRIRTTQGSVRIADVADVGPNSEANLDLKVLNHRGDPVRATKLFHSGNHPTFRVRTAEGFKITATANHPLLSLEAVFGVPMLLWRRVDEIAPGTVVAISRVRHESGPPPREHDRRLGILAGAWISEGWVGERRAGFNNTDADFFDEVVAAYDALVGGPRYLSVRPLPSGNRLHEIDVQDLGSWNASPLAGLGRWRSAEKRVPEFVWSASTECKVGFLQALFEGDGCVSMLPRNTIQISYSTYSSRLASEIQQLLLEFGVVARKCRPSSRGERKLVVGNRREARIFARSVGFLGRKQQLLTKLLSTVPRTSRALSHDHVPFLAAYVRAEAGRGGLEWLKKHNIDRIERWERDGDEILRRIRSDEVKRVIQPLVDGRCYFARVTSVEDAGVRPVYSIRVDSDDHSFISDGFVSHNTECRLAPVAMEMLRDIDEETVNFVPNYDNLEEEPLALPSRLPNLLVNGSTGIAVGMATNIPPHNLGEVIDAVVAMIDNPEITLAQLLRIVKGPDFPTAGIILGREGIKEAYTSGRGTVKVRARCEVEEGRAGRQRIVVTELPYMVSSERLAERIADLTLAKKLIGISDVKNETNRHGTRFVIELRRDAIPRVVLNNLFKHTQLQESFGMNMLALVDGVPRTLPLADILRHYLDHQIEVVTRRTRFRLRKAEERMHILEGMLIALDHLDAVIKLIRESSSADDARGKLMGRFELSEVQANAILDMQLRRLAALERQKIKDEAEELLTRIAELRSILDSPDKLRGVIKDELVAIKEKFANPRRTEIGVEEGSFDIEDLIPDEDVIITITRSGYIKRTKAAVYRTQGRGGKGVIGTHLKEGDLVTQLLTTTNHSYVLIFSNRGKVYRIKAHEIPEKDRASRGISIRNLLPFVAGERVATAIDTRDFETHKYLVIATKLGIIKKTAFGAYDSSRRDGIIALQLRRDDEVVLVRATSGEDELIMVSRHAQAIRFAESDVRPMGRTASGVIAMKLAEDDEVVSFDVVDPNGELLIITDAGYGKRTLLTHYQVQRRGGKGVKTAKLVGRRGVLAGAGVVRLGHEVFLISSDGQVIRIAVRGIARQGRATTGVRIMRLEAGMRLVGMAPVTEE